MMSNSTAWRKQNPERAKATQQAWQAKNPGYGKRMYALRKARSKTDITVSFGGIIDNSKYRAKKSGLEHTLTLEELGAIYKKQKGLCALTGKKMKTVMGSGHQMMSPDRINSKKGYTAKNVQLTLSIANKMKQDLTTAAFVKLCKAVVEYHKS
jgi:hypothetical protein